MTKMFVPSIDTFIGHSDMSLSSGSLFTTAMYVLNVLC